VNYEIISSDSKPKSAPEAFGVFDVDGDRYVFCPIRGRAYSVNNKPEEIVRQWWIYKLRDQYGYDFDQIDVEVSVTVGSTEGKKNADIVVYSDKKKMTARIFIEVKKPQRYDGVEQLKVYMNATGCRLGMWSNGHPPHVNLLRIEPTGNEEEATWRELRNIPAQTESLHDVDNPLTRSDLSPLHDFLGILRDCENHIKAHEGVSPFDEIFKLIFAKLYDERRNLKNDQSPARFYVGALESASDARARIDKLFNDARDQWAGVFEASDRLRLKDESLAYCVSAMQYAYLLKSDADVLGAAFEVMINPSMKGGKGQYFTPRHVVDMCINVLNPGESETIFDPACGSGGFLVSAMSHVFNQIQAERDDDHETLENQKDYASNNVFGIDYDPLIAKVAKAYMLIWGDGRSHIRVADGLNSANWDDPTNAVFLTGPKGKQSLRQFDIIATNPPFAGDISADATLSSYSLAYTTDARGRRKRKRKVARDVLFIERCLDFLKPGGRMAIVLPRGTLKNYTDEYVRAHVLRRARVAAVVSLTGQMFKPFTNTKTCVLFVEKRLNELQSVNDAGQDGDIIFAASEKPGKDRSGNLIRDDEGHIVSDLHEIQEFLREEIEWGQL